MIKIGFNSVWIVEGDLGWARVNSDRVAVRLECRGKVLVNLEIDIYPASTFWVKHTSRFSTIVLDWGCNHIGISIRRVTPSVVGVSRKINNLNSITILVSESLAVI